MGKNRTESAGDRLREAILENFELSNPEMELLAKASALVSLSILELDCPAPIGGWEPVLATRGAQIRLDDLGRPAIDRPVARELVTERAE